MLLWLQLLICISIIGFAGYFFYYGDIIAEKSGLSASRVLCMALSSVVAFTLEVEEWLVWNRRLYLPR
ncbi:MAG: hypothetical protein WA632_12405 [Gallionella sp.]